MTDRHIDRIVSSEEFQGLLKRKSIVIAFLRHRFKNYELRGHLKEVK